MKKMLLGMICAACVAVSGTAQAEDYPSRPVTLIVPFTAGGAFDMIARLAAQHLTEELGKQVVVINKPGAGGALGGQIVATSKPDGYTLLMSGTGPISISPAVYSKMSYKPSSDLVPVAQLAASPFVLVTSEKFAGNSAKDIVSLLKGAPGKYNYSSTGNGTIVQLFGELFKTQTETDFQQIPYPGGAEATTAILQGDVLFTITNVPNVKGLIDSKRAKALATTGTQRASCLSSTPTFAESGISGLELQGWTGVFAPKGTPESIVRLLNEKLAKAMKNPEVIARLAQQCDTPQSPSVEEFARYVQDSDQKWQAIAKRANVRIDN
jgi:tripartite-type tricarboxylate transporter receptor subunit TctC